MPTPPPWWTETQEAPLTALSRALRMGQSAMASETVFHAFGLTVGRSDRTRVQMVAADDDRSADLSFFHQTVDDFAESSPLSVAQPTDAGWKPLEFDPLAGLRTHRPRASSSGNSLITASSVA